MQIGGLGFIQSMGQASGQTNNSEPSGESSFKGLFSLLTSGNNVLQTGNETQLQTEQESQVHSLIQLLNLTDILDVENGLEMLNQFLAGDTSLFTIVAESGKLDNIIQSLAEKLTEADESFSEIDLSALEGYEKFIAVLSQIEQLSTDDLKKFLSEDLLEFVKTAKYAELLDDNELTAAERKQLLQLLNNLKEKLQSLVSGNQVEGKSYNSRAEYLQTTFAKVVEELQTQPKIVSNSHNQEPKTLKSEVVNGQAFMPHFARSEQLTLTLNMAPREVNTADLIKQFENILARTQFTNMNGTQKLFIRLYPEHLGSLRIELTQTEQGMLARILTTTLAAKEALENQLQALKQSFQLQNIQVERIEINQQMSHQERYLGKEQSGNQGSGEQRKEQSNEKNDDNENFTATFEELLVNTEA